MAIACHHGGMMRCSAAAVSVWLKRLRAGELALAAVLVLLPLALITNAPAASLAQSPQVGGTGQNGPIATISPSKLNFGTLLIGATSGTKTVTLMNTGNATLDITSVLISGAFLDSNFCGTTLAPGASCNVLVQFKPQTKGQENGTLSFTDNAPHSPQKVSLTGTGTVVKLSPPSLKFGDQQVDTQSAPQTINVTNTSRTTSLSFTAITLAGNDPGDFADTTTCSTTSPLAPLASCSIWVTFTPTQIGGRTAQVSISDSGGGSPQLAPLSGTGTN
jgi:hypothetical protein